MSTNEIVKFCFFLGLEERQRGEVCATTEALTVESWDRQPQSCDTINTVWIHAHGRR